MACTNAGSEPPAAAPLLQGDQLFIFGGYSVKKAEVDKGEEGRWTRVRSGSQGLGCAGVDGGAARAEGRVQQLGGYSQLPASPPAAPTCPADGFAL